MMLLGLALAPGLARVGLAALGPGSCAFIAINGQGPDSFQLVLLEPMDAGETIKVTFRMVDGSGNWVGASSSNDLTYTAPSCQLPGVTLDGVQGQTSGTAFAWSNSGEQLSNGGDTLIAVSGDDTPLCAASTEADTWGFVSGEQTALPSGLTANSADAITKGSVVSMCYQGVTSGTVADVKTAIADVGSNWLVNSLGNYVTCTSPATSFTMSDAATQCPTTATTTATATATATDTSTATATATATATSTDTSTATATATTTAMATATATITTTATQTTEAASTTTTDPTTTTTTEDEDFAISGAWASTASLFALFQVIAGVGLGGLQI